MSQDIKRDGYCCKHPLQHRILTFHPLRKCHLARVIIRRMPSTPPHHIRSLSIHIPSLGIALQHIKLPVGVSDIVLSDCQHQHDFDFGQCHFLPNAITRPTLKRAPCILGWVEWVTFRHEPTLRKELAWLRPMARVMVCAVVIAPYYAMVGRKALAVVTRKVKVRLTIAEGSYGGVYTKRLFDDSEGVGKLIKQLRLRRKYGSGDGNVRAEDLVVLGADSGENIRVLGEEVVGENGTRRGGIVTCEDEELDLSHGEVFERGIDACRGGVLGEVRFQSEVDDGFVLLVLFTLNDTVTAVKLAGKVTIHSAFVVDVHKWPENVDIF